MIKLISGLLLAETDWTTYALLGGAAVLLIVFFVMSNRSSKKRAKQLSDNLKVGAKVMSTGGVVGEVIEMTDTEIILKTGDGENFCYMRFVRQAIGYVYPDKAEIQGDKKEEEVYNEIK